MSSGYRVKTEDLRTYASKLASGTATANEIKTLVSDADVGDQSWGVVGLFVKDHYSQLLGDLNSLLDEMAQGYQSGAAKFNNAAEEYERYEDELSRLFAGITVDVDEAQTPPRL